MIPKVIHQTWKTNDVPEKFQKWSLTWKTKHPEWIYMFWTDQDIDDFVKQYYPQRYEMFQKWTYQIQRVDLFRCMILHHFGGVYVDLDFECIQPLDSLLNCEILLGQEPTIHAQKVYQRPYIISNAIMGSIPNHPFWMYVLDCAEQKFYSKYRKQILWSTGPGLLTECYDRTKNQYSFSVHSPDRFFSKVSQGFFQHQVNLHEIFGVHQWANSWLKQ